ncbi:pyrroline-5-carboxylate reductase [Prosthecobacter fusiformis]|uniref:Pyrroline-5-carboxylate reductase n=1 Tax=Prosthecobacter fusiformis TaxID=48464 RepID=A0A4R7SQ92_9BACT|nr:pyrroline-5-carboxylate reductase [Prosthecobacter fusiformis]TDU81402.1 pyrroline-5-carboxylate reductase [Prosthecobacter fusiformis]
MLKLGLIGCGKMGGALLRGVEQALGSAELQVALSDVVPAAVEALEKSLTCPTNPGTPEQVGSSSDVILLAVKPGDMKSLCEDLAKLEGSRLFISIAAGISIAQLESWLGSRQRVIRCMPNTPALVATGAAAFARGSKATAEDSAMAVKILGSVGTADEVSEKLLDAVTGLSGSGPAYVYTVIEALADGGVLMGLPRAASLRLAAQTVAGAAKMVLETGKHPATLRDEVTSPGGTTIAGLEQLEAHGLRHALIQAVRKATERSKELGA